MIKHTIPLVSYRPKPEEDATYLHNFFSARISELEKIKKSLSNDKLIYQSHIEDAKLGKGRFSLTYLEEFLLKINEKLKDVDDNIAINRYHLHGDGLQ